MHRRPHEKRPVDWILISRKLPAQVQRSTVGNASGTFPSGCHFSTQNLLKLQQFAVENCPQPHCSFNYCFVSASGHFFRSCPQRTGKVPSARFSSESYNMSARYFDCQDRCTCEPTTVTPMSCRVCCSGLVMPAVKINTISGCLYLWRCSLLHSMYFSATSTMFRSPNSPAPAMTIDKYALAL